MPKCLQLREQEKNFDIYFFCILRVLCWQGAACDVLLHWGRCACASSSYIYLLGRPTWLLNPTCAMGHSVAPWYFLHRVMQVLTPACCIAPLSCCSLFTGPIPASRPLLAHATWLRQHRSCSKCAWTCHNSHCVEIYRKNAGCESRGQRCVRACAVEMHMDMSLEPFCMVPCHRAGGICRRLEIYRKTDWESQCVSCVSMAPPKKTCKTENASKVGLVACHALGEVRSGLVEFSQLGTAVLHTLSYLASGLHDLDLEHHPVAPQTLKSSKSTRWKISTQHQTPDRRSPNGWT